MAVKIQLRRGTEAEWASADPILVDGELALSTDVSKLKVGNGVDGWSVLEYINVAEINWGDIGGTLSDQTDLQSELDGKQNDLGYTPEDVANKATDLTSPDNTKYPTTEAVQDGLDLKQNDLGYTPVDVSGDTMSGELNAVSDAYDDTWNGNSGMPQKNDIYDADLESDITLKAYQAMGSSIKAMTIGGMQFPSKSTSAVLTDGQVRFCAVYLSRAQTITGVKWFQIANGNYTADNNNKIGLYSYSGGTLTLVASCANDGNLWKPGAGVFTSKAFSTPYDALAGLYFVGMLYNNSAQTTAPSLCASGGTVDDTDQVALDFTNSTKMSASLAGQTDLPASQAMSGLSGQIAFMFFCLY